MPKTAEEKQEELEELEKAAETYEKLLVVSDGGREAFNQFDATTIMAMLDNHRYRAKVIKKHEELY